MTRALEDLYGPLVIVRAPCPVLLNKGGANYRSEVGHLEYSPRRAYDEWLAILDAVVAAGGDALCHLEAADEPYLDAGDLEVDGDGWIRAASSDARLGHVDEALTGRVFTANGPWVVQHDGVLRALMPRVVPHRAPEAPYYRRLLSEIAELCEHRLELTESQHPWEGMADVVSVGDRAILSYTVRGHFDEDGAHPLRSSREGAEFAADFAGVPTGARVYVELVHPHYHGDTVHFCARPPGGEPLLVHYAGGLWGDGAARVEHALDKIVPFGRGDALDHLAANCRQVGRTVLVPAGVSADFERSLTALGLVSRRILLRELLGKGGGGPACATLHLPASLSIPAAAPLRYTVSRDAIRARRDRIPERLTVAAEYHERKAARRGKARPISVRLVRRPRELAAAEAARLTTAFARISWRATRGGARRYDDLLPFWLDYYATAGNRPQDYDALVIAEDGDRIVSVIALNVVASDVGHLLWLHLAYTEPEYQGQGVLRGAGPALLALIAELPSPLYAVCRTLNPTVYDLMTDFARTNPAWAETFQPRIGDAGDALPVPDETRRLATQIAERLSPSCDYDPAQFVVRAFFSELRHIIGLKYPPSRAEATNRYFQRHCDYARGDGSLIFFRAR